MNNFEKRTRLLMAADDSRLNSDEQMLLKVGLRFLAIKNLAANWRKMSTIAKISTAFTILKKILDEIQRLDDEV